MNYHFLQSEEWQSFNKALGEKTVRVKEKDFEYLAIVKPSKLGNYLYLPYGPLLDEKSKISSLESALKTLAKTENAFFIRVEPTPFIDSQKMKELGFKKSKDLEPADTWALDLTPEKSEILTNFSQGTRTRFNTFVKKGVSVLKTKDPKFIKDLVDFQKSLSHEKKIGVFSEKYLKTELEQPFATLYVALFEEKPISASLFFDDEKTKTRFYMQSGTDPEFRKLPATVAILTTALFDAKENGFKTFDFWGIAPENAKKDHPWIGFTEFKKSFGGFPIHYTGTYDYPLSQPKYKLYKSLRKANRIKRKLKR